MSSLAFNSLLLHISSQLTKDQLASMKFLCRDIGKGVLENIESGTQLFQVLTERGKLGTDNTEYLAYLLEHVKRIDLLEKLNSFESGSGDGDDQPDVEERGRLEFVDPQKAVFSPANVPAE